ncbi:hypothetical protein AD929_00040, partial [Gluconobacter potus]
YLKLGIRTVTNGVPRTNNSRTEAVRVATAAPVRDVIAARYDKTALSFISFLNLAAARLSIKSFVNVT